MSQIEGTPEVVVEPQPLQVAEEADTIEYASEEERLFAEEVDRRERDGVEGEPTGELPLASIADPDTSPVVPAATAEPVVAQPDGDATPAPAVEAKPAWYDGLSEEAKLVFDQQQEQMQQLQWQYSAVHGRLAPVQAENDRLRRAATHPQPRPIAGGQPAPATLTPAPDFESKEFKDFAENYPDEAANMRRMAEAQYQNTQRLEARLEHLAQGLGEVQTFSTNQQMQSELSALEQRHPDWMTVRNSAEFDSWLQTQPTAVQPMVDSKRADECSYLLDRYKQDVYLYQLQQTAGNPAAPVAPNPQQVVAAQTVAHRATLINTPTPDPQGGGVGVPGGQRPPQTAEEMWVEELERRVRAQKAMRK
jgi:hypothetical protein